MDAPTWLLSQVDRHAHRLLTEALAGAGGRGYEYRVLAALEEFGPSSQASLGRRVGLDRSDVVAAVDALVAGGYVGRAPDPHDRRSNIISLTRAGRAHLGRLDRALAGVQDALLHPLSATERRQLVRLLRRVLVSLEGGGVPSARPRTTRSGSSGAPAAGRRR